MFVLAVFCSFVLNTTIVAPHEAQVTDMCFCQTSDSQTTVLVSASKDGHFKAWQLATQTEGKTSGLVFDSSPSKKGIWLGGVKVC